MLRKKLKHISPAEIVLAVVSVFTIFPLLYLILMSLQSDMEVASIPPTIIPSTPQFINYLRVIQRAPIFQWFSTSLIYALITTSMVIITSTLGAYALTKLNLPGSKLLTTFFISSILVPPQVRAFPLYTMIAKWGWVDTWQGLILPFAATGFSLFFMRQFMLTIPDDIIEAARIDGASELRILTHVIMPLSRPGLITVSLYTFIFRWNDYMWPLLVARKKLTTLTVGLSIFKSSEQLITWNLVAAAAMFIFVPAVILFILLRPYIMRSVAIDMK